MNKRNTNGTAINILSSHATISKERQNRRNTSIFGVPGLFLRNCLNQIDICIPSLKPTVRKFVPIYGSRKESFRTPSDSLIAVLDLFIPTVHVRIKFYTNLLRTFLNDFFETRQ